MDEPTKIFGPDLENILNRAGFYKKREWSGLTDEEIFDVADNFGYFKHGDAQGHKRLEYAKAIEAKLKERNNG